MKRILLIFLILLIPVSLTAQTRPHWKQISNKPMVYVSDYGAVVDDGDDDYAAIASAAEYAESIGASLQLTGGKYLLSQSLSLPDYSNVVGCASATISYLDMTDIDYPLILLGSNCSVSGLTLFGSGTHLTASGDCEASDYCLISITGDNNVVSDCCFLEIDDYGVLIVGDGSLNKIDGCSFENESALTNGVRGRYGVGITTISSPPADGNRITRNYFSKLACGISYVSNSTSSEVGFFGDITNTIIVNNRIASMSEHGIYASSGFGGVISNNIITEIEAGSGIKFRGRGGTITGNRLSSVATGIELAKQTNQTTVSANNIRTSVLNIGQVIGISIDGQNMAAFFSSQGFTSAQNMGSNVISGNVIQMPTALSTYIDVGIRAICSNASESVYFDNMLVTGNLISGYGTGVFLSSTNDFALTNNHIICAAGYASTTGILYGQGILLEQGNSGVQITGNKIASASVCGILGGTLYLSAATFNNNIISDCASYATNLSRVVAGSNLISVVGNTLYNNYGVQYFPEYSDHYRGNLRNISTQLYNDDIRYVATATDLIPTARGQIAMDSGGIYISDGLLATSSWRKVYP